MIHYHYIKYQVKEMKTMGSTVDIGRILILSVMGFLIVMAVAISGVF